MATQRLNQVPYGRQVLVKAVLTENPELAEKLLVMGIVSGATLEVLQAAPLGDPIRIKLLGYQLTLRLKEAESVEVTPL